jgi:hypothetical protein
MHFRISILAIILFLAPSLWAIPSDSGVYSLPLSCSELLPDPTPFMNFFEGVARGSINREPKLAKRIFRLLAYRTKVNELRPKDQNPVEILIRKTLCFYREQREPMKAIPIDDEKFLQYLRGSLKDLEAKVEEASFQIELERQQKALYEKKLQGTEALVEKVTAQMNREVDLEFERLAKAARRKVHSPK